MGGFIGNNYGGTIRRSYSTGNASSSSVVGGFCGSVQSNSSQNSIIENCYSTGNASGNAVVGGFCGSLEQSSGTASISNCFSIGSPTASSYLGGFIGLLTSGTLYCNYWAGTPSDGISDTGNPSDEPDNEIMKMVIADFSSLSNCPCFSRVNWRIDYGATHPLLNTIPTLSEWATIAFLSLILIFGAFFVYKRIV